MDIRIILTSAGGLVVPNIIKCLREDSDNRYFICATDRNLDAVGFYFSDKAQVVPSGEAEDYAESILSIAKDEHIDVVIPGSDEETLALSKEKEAFAREGVIVACSDYEVVRTASHKGLMLEFLSSKSVPVPNFHVARTREEIEIAVCDLGYPELPVVVKPCTSRGARGFSIIRSNFDKHRDFLLSRERQTITLDWLLESSGNGEECSEMLVMDYLEGADFNVDILTKEGKAVYAVPNQRLIPSAGPVQVGRIKENKKVQDMAETITEQFKFEYWVNIEMAYDCSVDPEPLVYEINPRISAPIVANTAAGINLLKIGIMQALGQTIDENLTFVDTKMIRYWNELFVY